jgi:regulator of sigma E protease
LDSNELTNTEPVDSGVPDHAGEVSALKKWFKDNLVSLVVTAIAIALVCIYLDPIDTLKVVIGLGLVIFIHELGHFLAAKWCDVHVKTFSIGFGPSVPFCSYKWGETTYMIGIIPLGGYVSMVGEGDNAGDDDAEEDPRSFRRKTVGQRMLIISAGVVMNILLGLGCFVAAYLHGVREEPATVGGVISGGAAWKVGIHSDDQIIRIDSRNNPSFKDLRPIVMRTRKGEELPLVVERDGKILQKVVEPIRDEGTYFPTLGINAQARLTLLSLKKQGFRPTIPGSEAANANPPFEPGDRIVGMTDPNNPATVTPLKPDPRDPENGANIDEYYDRMAKLADKPITFEVLRKGASADAKPIAVTVQPTYRADLGMRMRMGEIVALRQEGPAERAGVIARSETPPATSGDRIKMVKLTESDGKETWYTTGEEKDQPNVSVQKLDPILLPLELKKWAERNRNPANPTNPTLKLKLVVLRTLGHQENQPVDLSLDYDFAYQDDREMVLLPNSPIPIAGLGLAYWAEAFVEEVTKDGPAEAAGLRPKDIVTAVRFKALDDAGKLKTEDWADIKAHQWAWAEASFQSRPPYEIDLKVKRGEEAIEIDGLKGREDKNWPVDDRGLVFQLDFRIHKAADIGDALNMGALRTVRFIKEVYMNLYSIIFGRVSAKTMSGPLTIATASYRIAGEDFWQFLLFLGMISVNLAVVNFLPIPVLDGGHMVFLILEKILGRPVPERIFAIAMYTGLFLILSLMGFVIYLDVKRQLF